MKQNENSLLKYVDRRGSSSAKWDALTENYSRDDLLPLWVADMDFAVDSNITDALTEYIKSGVYGYYRVPDSYYDAFISWEKKYHSLDVDRAHIRFSAGVVSGTNLALQTLTWPDDSVMVSTPVYYPFLHAITNNDRKLVESELISEDGIYRIDFEDFERRIVENNVRAYILCSPHNPVSRVWTRSELAKLLDICRRHGVAVISDEIHHDFVYGDNVHTPTLSLAEAEDRIIMLTAASKSFNIAGLQNSLVVIPNNEVRDAWDSVVVKSRIGQGNTLGYIATEAAYRYGRPWLEELKAVITNNYDCIKRELVERYKGLVISPLEGTYLAWMDFGEYVTAEDLKSFMEDKCGLAFDYGDWFGGTESTTHIRINLATSLDNIKEMIRRVSRELDALRE